MISLFSPACPCGAKGEYYSRDKTPPHKLAHDDGWRVRGKGWQCGPCYCREKGLGVTSDGKPKIDRLREAINRKLGGLETRN